METPFFFPSRGRALYGVLHEPPAEGRRGPALVMCEPFGEEKLWANRVLVSFAREAAARGSTVLRFDCLGHGDSAGEFVESTVTTRVEDTQEAVRLIKGKSGDGPVFLQGLRFGATVAALACRGGAPVRGLALWDPVPRGEPWFMGSLRANLTAQMAMHRKILRTREDLIAGLLEGEPVNLEGYLVSPDFYREVVSLDLHAGLGGFAGDILLTEQSRSGAPGPEVSALAEAWRGLGLPVALAAVPGEPFWKDIRVYARRSEALFAETFRWLDAVSAKGEG